MRPPRAAAAAPPAVMATIVLKAALGEACAGAGANADAASARSSMGESSKLDERFAAAMSLYTAGDWAHAFTALAALADLGHVPASRLALLMLRYGTGWFRMSFSATPEQVARWARQVLRAPPCGPGTAAPQADAVAPASKLPSAPPARRDRSAERARRDAARHRTSHELDSLWVQPALRQAVCG